MKKIECEICGGSGKSFLGPIHDLDTGEVSESFCSRCDGAGEYEPTLEYKIEKNIWDHVRTVMPAIAKILKGRDESLSSQLKQRDWVWWRNSKCKYISLRIDMRSGACLLFDSNDNRISIEDLKYQRGKE